LGCLIIAQLSKIDNTILRPIISLINSMRTPPQWIEITILCSKTIFEYCKIKIVCNYVWCSKYYHFFMICCKIRCKNGFNLFFYKFTKIKVKSFECPKSVIDLIKNNAWNIRRLVDDSFVPANQQTSVLYPHLCTYV
jgi:hypothetical protein